MSNVLVISARLFNSTEFWMTLGILQNRGHTFEVVSTKHVIQDAETLKGFRLERTVKEVNAIVEMVGDKFDAIVIISGRVDFTQANWMNPFILNLIRAAESKNKPIATTGYAVPTIREVVEGKAISFYPATNVRSIMVRADAVLRNAEVTVSQNVITAEHPHAARMMVIELCNMLEGKPTEFNLPDKGFETRGLEQRPIGIVEKLRRMRQGEDVSNIPVKYDLDNPYAPGFDSSKANRITFHEQPVEAIE